MNTNAELIAEARRVATEDPVEWKTEVHRLLYEVTDALERTEQERNEAVAREAVLREAAQLAVKNFKRSHDSSNFLGDDDHEAWTALNKALATPSPAAERLLARVETADSIVAWLETGDARLDISQLLSDFHAAKEG